MAKMPKNRTRRVPARRLRPATNSPRDARHSFSAGLLGKLGGVVEKLVDLAETGQNFSQTAN